MRWRIRPEREVHLVESNGKKAAFLREAVRVTGAPAIVHAVRIEDFVKRAPEPIDVVTARALAPLAETAGRSVSAVEKGSAGPVSKGQDVDAELTEAAKCWNIQATLVPSLTDPKAQIVVVRSIEPRT